MYLIYCIILLLFVYIVPALAIYPRIMLSARTVAVIPFMSIFIIALIKSFLVLIGAFSHIVVLLVSIGLLLGALYRVAAVLAKSRLDWPKPHQLIIMFNLLLMLYFSVILGSSSFNSHDEIYSWNMWAVQHFLGEPVDYYYTKSPYPQLFSIIIAYCYKILGNIELQLPVKALFAIFPFCLLTAIGLAPKEASYVNVARYFVLMLVLVFGTGLNKCFDRGLADPMMASALTVSVFLFLRYVCNTERTEQLWFSVICGIVAVYTKQPALIWVIISFPIISLISVSRNKLPFIMIAAATILFIAGLAWVSGSGSNFYSNQGVINASQHGRNLCEQLMFAINRYFVKRPLILLLLATSFISVIKTKKYRDIFFSLLMPSLLAWFIFGAYSLRHGIHVVSLAALLLTTTGYKLPFSESFNIWKLIGTFIQKKIVLLMVVLCFIVVVASVLEINKSIRKIGDGFDLYSGGKNTIYKYFGNDAAYIHEKIYNNPDILLWIPSNYIYGIFYGHNNIMRPNYDAFKQYNIESIISEIKEYRPDYLFYSTPLVAYGPGSSLLYELAEKRCPYLFEKVTSPRNRFGYIVYRLKKDETLFSKCL